LIAWLIADPFTPSAFLRPSTDVNALGVNGPLGFKT